MNASCQCGDVQFRTPAAEPLAVYHCHCRECRRQSSSAYGTSAVFAVDDMSFLDGLAGKMSMYVRPGSRARTGRDMACYFCTRCGSRVMHRYLKRGTGAQDDGDGNVIARDDIDDKSDKNGRTDSCGGGGDGYMRQSVTHPSTGQQPRQPSHDLKEGDFDGATFTIKGGIIANLDYTSAVHIYTEHAVVPIPKGVEQYPGTPPGSP
ncbi:glutathione-dependent formaldehyde-activating [Ophiostoma piceae UAMH 11346]|uniref:Glutathione-dependent formaldehyde-activating n=1 Tax=Ophiostoma piceae (strain UAMH 11346) TaxID=1262450 RepID=S3BV34_OPHP1|nr:glutathione-dependent formaldehyde-activating [Ophiostoma piceae UAMH 11346]